MQKLSFLGSKFIQAVSFVMQIFRKSLIHWKNFLIQILTRLKLSIQNLRT